MEKNYSKRFNDILGFSKEEAERTGYNQIIPEHLLLGIIREGSGRAIDAISHIGSDIKKIKKSVDEKIILKNSPAPTGEIDADKSTNRILKLSVLEARLLSSDEVDSEHLLLALLKDESNSVAKLLENEHITYGKIYSYLASTNDESQKDKGSDLAYNNNEDYYDNTSEYSTPYCKINY
jgi:ATP-dependent Clp protease ATP-binding subunit ClpC